MKLIKVTAPSVCVRKGSKIQVDNDLQWIVDKVGLLQDDGTWVLKYDVDFKQGAVLLVEPPVARSLKGDIVLLDEEEGSEELSLTESGQDADAPKDKPADMKVEGRKTDGSEPSVDKSPTEDEGKANVDGKAEQPDDPLGFISDGLPGSNEANAKS